MEEGRPPPFEPEFSEDGNQLPTRMPENPFPQEYGRGGQGNMQLPDAPMQDDGTSKMLKILIDNDSTPIATKKKFHWMHSRDLVLTFLDEDRKRQKLLSFEILKLCALNNTPWYDYDFAMEQQWQEERFELEVRCDRALGFDKGNRINERIVQQAQFTEQRQIMNDESSVRQSSSFFGKIASFVSRR